MTTDTGTSLGVLSIIEICELIGTGPGRKGRPVYNDIQCGNGPPSVDDDLEIKCPGRVDLGSDGCGMIGPKWNFDHVLGNNDDPTTSPTPQPTLIHPDIVKVIDVVGERNPRPNWRDSYSVGDRCYCDTNFDHNIGPVLVDTPLGKLTVREACTLIGDGPGRKGNPVYNDVQCGNGPPNDAGDEDTCPGRTDLGRAGCGHIGPKWNFDDLVEEFETVVVESTFEQNAEGFRYLDDPWYFTGTQETFANGGYSPTGGLLGSGCLRMRLGGISATDVMDITGGFYTTFNLESKGVVSVSFAYSVEFSPAYEIDEYSEVRCMVDGIYIGADGNDYVDYIDNTIGTIPWKAVTLDVGMLDAGSYTLSIGGYNNQKTYKDEVTIINFDDVAVTLDTNPFSGRVDTTTPTIQPTSTPSSYPTSYPTFRPSLLPSDKPSIMMPSSPPS